MIFKIRAALAGGTGHAFLNDRTLSAHPEEEEYLLGYNYWNVTQILDRKEPHPDHPEGEGVTFTLTEITVKDPNVR